MKRWFKAVFSLVMALVMCFCSTSIAFAREKVTPVILVHGMGVNPVYENVNTKNQKEIVNFGLGSTSDIISGVLSRENLLCEVLKMLDPEREVNADVIIDELADYVKISNINCTKDGNIRKGQGIDNYWTDSLANHRSYWENAYSAEPALARQLCNAVGAKNVYMFNYDWRVDICKNAEKLRSLVKTVKKNTGAKKVSLIGASLGGSILSAYIDAYKGKKDIESCIFVNPAFQGVNVARIYAKDLTINRKMLLDYLGSLESTLYDGSKSSTFRLITAIGDVRIGYAADYFEELFKNEKYVNRMFIEVMKPLLGNITALWECIPYDCYNKAVREMSKIGFLDKKSGVYKKIKKYHAVQGRLESNLKAIKKQGVQVAVIANYGTMGIPLTSKAYEQTDILIDTRYASGGATTAKIGSKLKAKGKYVSPDKQINAKTCILPDNTWFIKNMQHVDFVYGTPATKLIADMTVGKVKCNITAVKKKYKLSQFLKSDSNQNITNV